MYCASNFNLKIRTFNIIIFATCRGDALGSVICAIVFRILCICRCCPCLKLAIYGGNVTTRWGVGI